MQYARTEKSGQTQEAKTETDVWMEQVEAVYRSFSRRMDPACWRELLLADVCQSLADEEEVRRLHFYLFDKHRLIHIIIVFFLDASEIRQSVWYLFHHIAIPFFNSYRSKYTENG